MPQVTLQDARQKAREIHFGRFSTPGEAPGRHAADGYVADLLMSGLQPGSIASRASRVNVADARALWDPSANATLAEQLNAADADQSVDPTERLLAERGVLKVADQYTAERVNNLKTEVVSRFVASLITPETTILNNFFRTVQADAGDSFAQIREFVSIVEAYSDWSYYEIDPLRGDIRSIEVNMTQTSDRINPTMRMYGVKVEYENFLFRVLENVSIAELMAMLSVGWAKASSLAREHDASKYLTNFVADEVAFDNNANAASRFGQLSGLGFTGDPNGTFDVDYDLPRLMDFMRHEQGMSTDNLTLLLPRNAWSFMNTKKGYRRMLGLDNQSLYQSPAFQPGPKPAMWSSGRYGLRNQGVGHSSPAQAAKYLSGTREHNAARAAEQMVPGPNPFLPASVPNWQNVFSLPNSAFGPLKVVLTPFNQAQHKFFADGHAQRNDPNTGKPRPVAVTDMMFFDGNHPLWMIESIPPTSWTATNDEHRKSVVVMVEAYAMANSARGQQAVTVKGAVLDNAYQMGDPVINRNAADLAISDKPLGDGLANS